MVNPQIYIHLKTHYQTLYTITPKVHIVTRAFISIQGDHSPKLNFI